MDTLYIPVNIKTRFEFFEGYGMPEMAATAVVTCICIFLAYSIHLATGAVTMPVLMTLIVMSATVMITAKDQQNLSIIDHTRNLIRFMNGQKKYPYCYRKEWSM